MTTRSSRLAAASVPIGAFTTVYTCPAGAVTILKDIHTTQAAGTGVQCDALIQRPAGTVAVYLFQGQPTNSLQFDWQGWVILEAGDELQIFANVSSATVWVSGAELLDDLF